MLAALQGLLGANRSACAHSAKTPNPDPNPNPSPNPNPNPNPHSAKTPFGPNMAAECDGSLTSAASGLGPVNLTDADVTGMANAELYSPYARTRAAATADAKAAQKALAAAEAEAAAIEADPAIEAKATWSRVVTEVRDFGRDRKAAQAYINRDELLPGQADLCFYRPDLFHDPRYEDLMFVGKRDLALLSDELGFSAWKWALLGLAAAPAAAATAVWAALARRRALEADGSWRRLHSP